MNLQTLKDMSPRDLKEFLDTHASKVTEGIYTKPLTESEIQAYQAKLASESISAAILIDEFNKKKEEHKAKLKPVQKEISTALQACKFKAIDMQGKIYTIQDFDQNMIHEIDEHGNIILSRQPRPEERQYFMKPSISKAS